jgi:Domain of unknown function (DUF6984)
MRELSDSEKFVVSHFSRRLPELEGTKLMRDLSNATVQATAEDGCRVLFHIAGYERPVSPRQHPIKVEGEVTDKDGVKIWILLHVDANGRLFELELIREGPGKIVEPDWTSLKIF